MFLRIYQHLLPKGRAWSIIVEKRLRQFFQGLTPVWDNIKESALNIYRDLFVDSTRALEEWEDQFGQVQELNTEEKRLERLRSLWKASGGQSPRYLQDVLQEAGFNVFIHEWWQPVEVRAIDYNWSSAGQLADWNFIRYNETISNSILTLESTDIDPQLQLKTVGTNLPFSGEIFNTVEIRWDSSEYQIFSSLLLFGTGTNPNFSPDRRIRFGFIDDPEATTTGPDSEGFYTTVIDMSTRSDWTGDEGDITRIRFDFGGDIVGTINNIDYIRTNAVPTGQPPVPRNPLLYLADNRADVIYTTECGEPLAECGEPTAACGETLTPPGYALVNKITEARVAGVDCGEPLAECGEPLAECGEVLGFSFVPREYNIPIDSDTWSYFLYFGGETFPETATVDVTRRDEFERLLLKNSPLEQWLGVLVDYE